MPVITLRLDEDREPVERLAPAGFVVGGRKAGRKVLVHGDELGAAGGVRGVMTMTITLRDVMPFGTLHRAIAAGSRSAS